jgi:hypothetical protein
MDAAAPGALVAVCVVGGAVGDEGAADAGALDDPGNGGAVGMGGDVGIGGDVGSGGDVGTGGDVGSACATTTGWAVASVTLAQTIAAKAMATTNF